MSALKGYLIAFALLIAGVLAALFTAKTKQRINDINVAKQTVDVELDKIKVKANDVQVDVQKLPPVGPDSATQQLRNDWSDSN